MIANDNGIETDDYNKFKVHIAYI